MVRAAIYVALLLIAFGFPSYLQAQPLLQDWQKSEMPEFSTKKASWATNRFTRVEERKRAGEFRKWVWLDAYKANADRSRPCDAEIVKLMESWLETDYGTPKGAPPNFVQWCDRLLARPDCDDPLFLAFTALHAPDPAEKFRRLQRALAGFPKSRHKAYARFNAQAALLDATGMPNLIDVSLQAMKDCFSDGSFRPEDQAEIAEIFFHGWATTFFFRMPEKIYPIAQAAGKEFEWLALVLEGEFHLRQAWIARGDGLANTVTDKGAQGFSTNSQAARRCFTKAWELRPDLVLAPTRMISVATGVSDAQEMRLWFDRALSAQIDYPQAWEEMRWGLRSRWHGDPEIQLALGKLALNSERFDTDVPRKFMDILADVESDAGAPLGKDLYGSPEIWPGISKMFEGYLAQPDLTRSNWQSGYSVAAFLAGKYDIARKQLEAIKWEPREQDLSARGRDLALMPLEVAARTGPLAEKVTKAEAAYEERKVSDALKDYEALSKTTSGSDPRAAKFIQHRVATLKLEEKLAAGEWVDFLPADTNAPGWLFLMGTVRRLPDGALEAEADKSGHLIYCRARVGTEFEVRGEIEIIKTSTQDFQAGVVFGVPSLQGLNWCSFRMKRKQGVGDRLHFAQAWDRQQKVGLTWLKQGRNAFQLHVKGEEVSASINGRPVLQDQELPDGLLVSEAGYMVGLGALGDLNQAVVRYHKIQVRRGGL